MKKEEFYKGIKEMQQVALTEREKAVMLQNIFATPTASPYTQYFNILTLVHRPALFIAVLCLTLVSGSAVYASERALPGEALYSVKVKVLEPLRSKLYMDPEKKLEWEAKRVEKRLTEAKALAEEDNLDEEKILKIEKKIEKDTAAYVHAVEKAASKAATSTEGKEKKERELKDNLLKKLEGRKVEATSTEAGSTDPHSQSREKVNRLKEKAKKTLELKSIDIEKKGSSKKHDK